MTTEEKAEIKVECLKLLPRAVDEMAKALHFVGAQRQGCEDALRDQIDRLVDEGTDPELIKKNLRLISERFNSGNW
jgi:hypothetical protein